MVRGAKALMAICERRQQPLPGALWFSRWRRTAQTAALVSETLGLAEDLRHSEDSLIPGASVAGVDEALQGPWLGDQLPPHLVLVSHQPLVSSLVRHWLGEAGRAPSHPPGGLVTLELSAPAAACAVLAWWALPPDYEASA